MKKAARKPVAKARNRRVQFNMQTGQTASGTPESSVADEARQTSLVFDAYAEEPAFDESYSAYSQPSSPAQIKMEF